MSVSNPILHDLLDPLGACLTPEVAARVVGLRASEEVQARVEELGRRSSAGQLTPTEQEEYDSYVSVSTFVAVLQSKARLLLKNEARSNTANG